MKTVNLTEEEHAELLKLRAKNKATASAPETRDVVRAAGTSEGAKKGAETKKKGIPSWAITGDFDPMKHPVSKAKREAGSATSDAWDATYGAGNNEDSQKEAAELHEKAAKLWEKIDDNQSGTHKKRAAKHLESYHRIMSKKSAKASDATDTIAVKATWSDAARKAAAEAKRGHTLDGDSIHEGMDVRPRHQYGGKPGRVTGWDSDKSFIKVKHEDGTSASYHHSDLHTHYGDEDDSNTRASAQSSIEAIYAEHRQLATAAHSIAVEVLGEPLTAESIYAEYAVRASGNSEGAKKGWESREGLSSIAGISDSGMVKIGEGQKSKSGGESFFIKHKLGGEVHADQVKDIHKRVSSHLESEGFKKKSQTNGALHGAGSAGHSNEIYENKTHQVHLGGTGFSNRDWNGYIHIQPKAASNAKASDMNEELEIIHCRLSSAAGSVLAADAAWSPGESVEFMWMPAGRHTICAGFRNGSIELTVNCDENTAANVQASLDAWRAERPKQEPFGCVEHREHEASVRVSAQQAFSFKQDGVYIAAEPTVLGAQNVNGKVHRSWSPSFTTDADYSQAKTIKTASGATVMVFPEGVRGSRSNPAEITGVDFCVGTLTNKPAFHAMSPVKSSEAEVRETVKAAWSDEARKASAEARKRHGLEGAKLEHTPEHFTKNAHYHEAMAEHHEEEHRLQPTDRREADAHAELADMHSRAAFHYEHAAKAAKKGLHDLAGNHLRSAERYGIDADDSYREPAKASSATSGDQVHAHCRATLLQDVPDATPEEIACYEKCIDEGGSHIAAVTEIRAKRDPGYVTQPAKATEDLALDAIYAERQSLAESVTSIAEEAGCLTLEAVYAEAGGTVKAGGTSEGAKKGWEVRMHNDRGGKGMWNTLHIEHAETMEDAKNQAGVKGKGSAFPYVGHAKRKKELSEIHEAANKAYQQSKYGEGPMALPRYKASAQDLELQSIYARAGGNAQRG